MASVPAGAREAAVAEEAQRLIRTPFDLTHGPLFRLALIRLRAEEHVLVVVMHHIVSDGASIQLIVEELAALYRARLAGEAARLPPLAIQYADFASGGVAGWKRGEQAKQLGYWKNVLGAEHPVLHLPTDRPRSGSAQYAAARFGFELPRELVGAAAEARAWAEHNGVHAAARGVSGAAVPIHRAERYARWVTNANRQRAEIQRVVGFFVNTQVLGVSGLGVSRASVHWSIRFARASSVRRNDRQELPFEQLVEALQPERSLDHPPLFQVMMNHQRRDFRALEQLPGLRLQRYEVRRGRSAIRAHAEYG